MNTRWLPALIAAVCVFLPTCLVFGDSPVMEKGRSCSLTLSYREHDDGHDPVAGAESELFGQLFFRFFQQPGLKALCLRCLPVLPLLPGVQHVRNGGGLFPGRVCQLFHLFGYLKESTIFLRF